MAEQLTRSTWDVRPGERLVLNGPAMVELVHKSGQLSRLQVTAPREVRIQKIHNEDVQSVPSMAN